jgi:hypothetical protein
MMLQGIFQRAQIVELHNPRSLGRIHRRPDVPAPWTYNSILQHCKRFIHRPVSGSPVMALCFMFYNFGRVHQTLA